MLWRAGGEWRGEHNRSRLEHLLDVRLTESAPLRASKGVAELRHIGNAVGVGKGAHLREGHLDADTAVDSQRVRGGSRAPVVHLLILDRRQRCSGSESRCAANPEAARAATHPMR